MGIENEKSVGEPGVRMWLQRQELTTIVVLYSSISSGTNEVQRAVSCVVLNGGR